MASLLGALVGFLITITVLSYVFFHDWALFRLVMYVFIGVTAGYAGAVAFRSVLWPMLFQPLIFDRQLLLLVPLFLVLLLLTKAFEGKISRWGNVAVAYLVGVGAAVAVGGAVQGTILPQTLTTMDAFNFRLMTARGIGWAEFLTTGTFMLVGTVTTLAYFHFGAHPRKNRPPQRRKWISALGVVGEWFIAITFGALFAGVYLAAATALASSASTVWQFILRWLPH
ncbi:MAG TPA: hypothetical protein ENJ54_04080 [Chloroflexi bacterium]|nr:hypothetical protein [Chloroflexota bacterium]